MSFDLLNEMNRQMREDEDQTHSSPQTAEVSILELCGVGVLFAAVGLCAGAQHIATKLFGSAPAASIAVPPAVQPSIPLDDEDDDLSDDDSSDADDYIDFDDDEDDFEDVDDSSDFSDNYDDE